MEPSKSPFVASREGRNKRVALALNPLRFAPHLRTALSDMTQRWDTTVPNEEKPNEKSRAIRARQRAIGRELRRMYDDVAQEQVPDDFLDLLRKIDEAAENKSGKKVS
jgi:hypothetical protein